MTKHSIERARERAGLSKNAAEHIFEKAFLFGETAESLPSKERNYMLSKSEGDKSLRLYGDFLYLFTNDGICVTMYHKPIWFCRKSNYSGKIRIRNPKKYFNSYCLDMTM